MPVPLLPAHGAVASHRGLGKSGHGICADAPQRRIFAGRKTGGRLESGLGKRAKVRCTDCPGPLRWREGFVVRAADVHELERRDGRRAGEILPAALEADFGGGGRCGFAIGRNPVAAGSSGGHHGLESIERHLASREFARLRIGIGRKDGAREITGHVLGKFDSTENGLLEKVLDRASSQIETWLESGIDRAMSQFNGVADSTNEKKK
jgi:Peptidyl-tRNA hydrolase